MCGRWRRGWESDGVDFGANAETATCGRPLNNFSCDLFCIFGAGGLAYFGGDDAATGCGNPAGDPLPGAGLFIPAQGDTADAACIEGEAVKGGHIAVSSRAGARRKVNVVGDDDDLILSEWPLFNASDL